MTSSKYDNNNTTADRACNISQALYSVTSVSSVAAEQRKHCPQAFLTFLHSFFFFFNISFAPLRDLCLLGIKHSMLIIRGYISKTGCFKFLFQTQICAVLFGSLPISSGGRSQVWLHTQKITTTITITTILKAAKTAGAARKTIGLALSSWALHRQMITHLTLAAL